MTDRRAGVLTAVARRTPGTVTRRCPRCWSEHLRPVHRADDSNLLCIGCHRCWRLEDGYLVQVNPYACAGCADRGLCRAIV